jgi:protein-S-isoprenylcysteine O-methyltransferase Ste14
MGDFFGGIAALPPHGLGALAVIFLAMKAPGSSWIPEWFRAATLPGMPAIAWAGVAAGFAGCGVRLWSVLTLRERYTRTLLTHDGHAVERGGPYRWVRHPGYLGSLLVLNGVAMASGSRGAGSLGPAHVKE